MGVKNSVLVARAAHVLPPGTHVVLSSENTCKIQTMGQQRSSMARGGNQTRHGPTGIAKAPPGDPLTSNGGQKWHRGYPTPPWVRRELAAKFTQQVPLAVMRRAAPVSRSTFDRHMRVRDRTDRMRYHGEHARRRRLADSTVLVPMRFRLRHYRC
jgi:hypothetical protein